MKNAADTDLVSVIVPIYNAGIRLVDALVSAQEQTHANLEIICVDDGSTDDSAAIMDLFAAEDERFRVIRKENAGYGAAMNDGLAAARGAWVAILEPDDWMDADMLEEMLAFASAFAETPDVVKCPFWWVPPGDEFGDAKVHCTYKGLIRPKTQPFGPEEAPELFAHHPSIWSALYRKAYLDEQRIRFPEYSGSGWADNRFLADTLLKTRRIAYLDVPFYHYRASAPSTELAFIRKDPALPFKRWMDITHVMETQGVRDTGILQAHARHGFTYLAQAAASGVMDAPEAVEAVQVMFNHVDEGIVLEDPSIPPRFRTLFAQMRGIECVRPNRTAHAAYLAKEALRRVRRNGVAATLRDAKRVFGAPHPS